jgi:hypothetical protein
VSSVTLVTKALKTAQKLFFLKMGISKNGGNWHLEAVISYLSNL